MTRVGVIGGGQLAWMMAGAAKDLGIELVVQTPKSSDPAAALASDVILAPIDDVTATQQLAARCDRITFENEFIDLEALRPLEQQGVCFRPRLDALAPLLDKYSQRQYLKSIGLPTPRFIAAETSDEWSAILAELSRNQIAFPLVLKTRRHGYDGQGTFILANAEDLRTTWEKLGHQPILLEEFVPFNRELAAIAARSASGEFVCYPIVETQQEDRVCRRVLAPANLDDKLVATIEANARTLLEKLDVVGLFGIEFFLTAADTILVNEIAPRTHNSGHFSLDACHTSQFEQLLRAACDLPLGDASLFCDGAVMINLLGYEYSQSDYRDKLDKLASIPHARLHWYGKTEARPGRKLGHITVLQQAHDELSLRDRALAIARQIEALWYGEED